MKNSRRVVPWLAAMSLLGLLACSESDPMQAEEEWPTPDPLTISAPGLPTMPVPAGNPLTVQGVALGRRLYYDPILSLDSTQACASCHQFGRAFSEPRRFSVGIDGIEGTRNAPALTNAAWIPVLFWDGRAGNLEDQALEPVVNPIEMHEDWDNVVDKLQRHSLYPELFGRAFGTDRITRTLVVKAIAQFERTFVSTNSKYDRFARGEGQLTDAESRGLGIFFTEAGDCFHCHVDGLFTDGRFHNIGLDSPLVDLGLGGVSGDPADMGTFKTPSLRNVELTAPYMHDGRFETLRDVVNHYNAGGKETSTLDPLMRKSGIGLGLTPQQVDDLIAFLETLTDPDFVNNPDLANPFE